MIDEKFDAIVIGAGMSGNAAAYTLASRGLKVLQLERGEYPGSKNVQGAILYSDMLEKVIPNFRDDAPLERHLVEQRFWFMTERSHTGMHYRSEDFNEEKPNRYTIIRSQFDRWFSKKAQEKGVILLTETTALELIQDAYGKVIGVRTDRVGGTIMADVVVLAEGVNGLLGTRAAWRGSSVMRCASRAPGAKGRVGTWVKTRRHALKRSSTRTAIWWTRASRTSR